MARQRAKEEITVEDTAVQAIEKAFAATTAVQSIKLHEGHRVDNVLSTGVLILDLILGGGMPRGKIVDFVGPEGCGKSTILQHIVTSAQIHRIPVVHYDYEFGADPTYMRACGVNLHALIQHKRKKYRAYHYTQPTIGEDGYEHIHDSLRRMPDVDQEKSGLPTAVFMIDSLAAMTPRGRDMVTGEGAVGLSANMHATHMNLIKGELGRKGALLVVTNQVRANLKMGPGGGGGGHSEPGGFAVKHYPDVKVKMSGSSSAKTDAKATKVWQKHLWLRTTKNKGFPPFQEAECDIMLGRGIDPASDAKAFLEALGKFYDSKNGRYKILLPQFETDKTISWAQFRRVAQDKEFRDYCFRLLKRDAVYSAYFKQIQMNNYLYDTDYATGSEDGSVTPG